MTYISEEREKAEVRNRLRLERLKQIRVQERAISQHNNARYQALKREHKHNRHEIEAKKNHAKEVEKLNSILSAWNDAVLQTGEAHRQAKEDSLASRDISLQRELLANQRKLAASRRQVEALKVRQQAIRELNLEHLRSFVPLQAAKEAAAANREDAQAAGENKAALERLRQPGLPDFTANRDMLVAQSSETITQRLPVRVKSAVTQHRRGNEVINTAAKESVESVKKFKARCLKQMVDKERMQSRFDIALEKATEDRRIDQRHDYFGDLYHMDVTGERSFRVKNRAMVVSADPGDALATAVFESTFASGHVDNAVDTVSAAAWTIPAQSELVPVRVSERSSGVATANSASVPAWTIPAKRNEQSLRVVNKPTFVPGAINTSFSPELSPLNVSASQRSISSMSTERIVYLGGESNKLFTKNNLQGNINSALTDISDEDILLPQQINDSVHRFSSDTPKQEKIYSPSSIPQINRTLTGISSGSQQSSLKESSKFNITGSVNSSIATNHSFPPTRSNLGTRRGNKSPKDVAVSRSLEGLSSTTVSLRGGEISHRTASKSLQSQWTTSETVFQNIHDERLMEATASATSKTTGVGMTKIPLTRTTILIDEQPLSAARDKVIKPEVYRPAEQQSIVDFNRRQSFRGVVESDIASTNQSNSTDTSLVHLSRAAPKDIDIIGSSVSKTVEHFDELSESSSFQPRSSNDNFWDDILSEEDRRDFDVYMKVNDSGVTKQFYVDMTDDLDVDSEVNEDESISNGDENIKDIDLSSESSSFSFLHGLSTATRIEAISDSDFSGEVSSFARPYQYEHQEADTYHPVSTTFPSFHYGCQNSKNYSSSESSDLPASHVPILSYQTDSSDNSVDRLHSKNSAKAILNIQSSDFMEYAEAGCRVEQLAKTSYKFRTGVSSIRSEDKPDKKAHFKSSDVFLDEESLSFMSSEPRTRDGNRTFVDCEESFSSDTISTTVVDSYPPGIGSTSKRAAKNVQNELNIATAESYEASDDVPCPLSSSSSSTDLAASLVPILSLTTDFSALSVNEVTCREQERPVITISGRVNDLFGKYEQLVSSSASVDSHASLMLEIPNSRLIYASSNNIDNDDRSETGSESTLLSSNFPSNIKMSNAVPYLQNSADTNAFPSGSVSSHSTIVDSMSNANLEVVETTVDGSIAISGDAIITRDSQSATSVDKSKYFFITDSISSCSLSSSTLPASRGDSSQPDTILSVDCLIESSVFPSGSASSQKTSTLDEAFEGTVSTITPNEETVDSKLTTNSDELDRKSADSCGNSYIPESSLGLILETFSDSTLQAISHQFDPLSMQLNDTVFSEDLHEIAVNPSIRTVAVIERTATGDIDFNPNATFLMESIRSARKKEVDALLDDMLNSSSDSITSSQSTISIQSRDRINLTPLPKYDRKELKQFVSDTLSFGTISDELIEGIPVNYLDTSNDSSSIAFEKSSGDVRFAISTHCCTDITSLEHEKMSVDDILSAALQDFQTENSPTRVLLRRTTTAGNLKSEGHNFLLDKPEIEFAEKKKIFVSMEDFVDLGSDSDSSFRSSQSAPILRNVSYSEPVSELTHVSLDKLSDFSMSSSLTNYGINNSNAFQNPSAYHSSGTQQSISRTVIDAGILSNHFMGTPSDSLDLQYFDSTRPIDSVSILSDAIDMNASKHWPYRLITKKTNPEVSTSTSITNEPLRSQKESLSLERALNESSSAAISIERLIQSSSDSETSSNASNVVYSGVDQLYESVPKTSALIHAASNVSRESRNSIPNTAAEIDNFPFSSDSSFTTIVDKFPSKVQRSGMATSQIHSYTSETTHLGIKADNLSPNMMRSSLIIRSDSFQSSESISVAAYTHSDYRHVLESSVYPIDAGYSVDTANSAGERPGIELQYFNDRSHSMLSNRKSDFLLGDLSTQESSLAVSQFSLSFSKDHSDKDSNTSLLSGDSLMDSTENRFAQTQTIELSSNIVMKSHNSMKEYGSRVTEEADSVHCGNSDNVSSFSVSDSVPYFESDESLRISLLQFRGGFNGCDENESSLSGDSLKSKHSIIVSPLNRIYVTSPPSSPSPPSPTYTLDSLSTSTLPNIKSSSIEGTEIVSQFAESSTLSSNASNKETLSVPRSISVKKYSRFSYKSSDESCEKTGRLFSDTSTRKASPDASISDDSLTDELNLRAVAALTRSKLPTSGYDSNNAVERIPLHNASIFFQGIDGSNLNQESRRATRKMPEDKAENTMGMVTLQQNLETGSKKYQSAILLSRPSPPIHRNKETRTATSGSASSQETINDGRNAEFGFFSGEVVESSVALEYQSLDPQSDFLTATTSSKTCFKDQISEFLLPDPSDSDIRGTQGSYDLNYQMLDSDSDFEIEKTSYKM